MKITEGNLHIGLLDNACRHAGSLVTTRVWTDEDADIVVDVIDDGPGIPPADRARVFDRFTRLDDARDRGSGGTGLGLPIAREITVRHGGTLTIADSTAGTHMLVRLPCQPHPTTALPSAKLTELSALPGPSLVQYV